MGAPALAQPAAAPETPQTPSAAPETAAPSQTPTPGDPGAPGAAGAPAGATPAAPPIPTDVPYARFRQAQTERTKIEREYQAFKQQQTAEAAKLQAQYEKAQKQAEEYREYYEMLEQHPDIAEQLIARLSQPGRVARPTAPAAPVQAALPKEVVETMQQMQAYMKGQQAREQQAIQAQRDQETSRQLDSILTPLLTQRGYTDKFLPHVRQFVVTQAAMAADRGERVELDDVPYLAGQWLKTQEELRQEWLKSVRDSKVEGATLPSTPGPSNIPTSVSPDSDAFGPKTTERLLKGLTDMGWGRQAG